jgi:steroid 5-alpha reductase family enzyme
MTPDARFKIPVTLGANILCVVLLLAYWYIPFATFTKDYPSDMNTERIMWAILSNVIGVFFMIGADVQKHTHLKLKKGLISDGFFERTRNPNYFGEILIYLSFGIISNDCIAYGILFTVWSVLFASSCLMKEKSFMKKAGWDKYKD